MSLRKIQDFSQRFSRILPNSDLDEDDESLKTIQQTHHQWKNRQKVNFRKIRKKEFESHNIKLIFCGFGAITLMAIAIKFMPNMVNFSSQKMAEFLPKKETVTINETDSKTEKKAKKGTLIAKLKELKEKNQQKNSSNSVTQKKNLNESLDESFDNIDKHNENLQKAIDISDGK